MQVHRCTEVSDYREYDSFLPDGCCITFWTIMEYNYITNAMLNYANTGSIDGTNNGGVPQSDRQQSGFQPRCGERSIHLTQASEQLPPQQSTVNSKSAATKKNSRQKRGKVQKAQPSKPQKSDQQTASSDQSKEAVTVQNYEENDAVVRNAHENLPNVNSSQLAFHSNNTSPQTNYANNQLNNSGIIYPAFTEPDASNRKRYSDALANAYQLKAYYNAFPPHNFNNYLQSTFSRNQDCVLPVVTDPKVSISSNNLQMIASNANNAQSIPLASSAYENTYFNNQKQSTETHWSTALATKSKTFSDTLHVEIPPPPSCLANYMSSENTVQAMNSSTIDLQSAQSHSSGATPLACSNTSVMPKLNNNLQADGTSTNSMNWERPFPSFSFFTCSVCNANFYDYYAFKMHAQLHTKPVQTNVPSKFPGTSAMLQNSAFSPLGASSVALPRSNFPPYYKQSNITGGHEQMSLGKPNYPMLNAELYSAFTNFHHGGVAGNLRFGIPPPVMSQVNFPNYGHYGIANQKGVYGQQPSVASDILNPQNANASTFTGLG
ncbi:hypothetical protein T11_8553 [Trichinella zimbabwensis]|uniref:C2H2-type domain-containing protein n=1 Tax=Trichinella zimbabwensis TaxID=268475 RepID=A0A0V1HGI0_9BILA|nr:hypothetical protein T11_8553 [Trichinella zimbabwensis]